MAMVAVASGCSSADSQESGHDTPERAVVSWFEAIDAGDAEAASDAIHPHSLALVLGTENSLPFEVTSEFLEGGVPIDVQKGYWQSFAMGFSSFAGNRSLAHFCCAVGLAAAGRNWRVSRAWPEAL